MKIDHKWFHILNECYVKHIVCYSMLITRSTFIASRTGLSLAVCSTQAESLSVGNHILES